MAKKKGPPRGGTRDDPSSTSAHRQTSGRRMKNNNPTGKVNPTELPAFRSLDFLVKRLIPTCKPNGDGKCTCPWHKHPPEQSGKVPIEKFWNAPGHLPTWPAYPFNVGIKMGSRLAVLDEDPRNGGRESLASLCTSFGPLPPTPTVATGGDGHHYYFEVSESQASWAGAGLELKATGQVIAPGSLHPSGKLYAWERSPQQIALAPLPVWLQSKPKAATRPQLTLVPASTDEDPRPKCWTGELLHWKREEWTRAEVEKRARLYLRAMPESVSGERGHDVAFHVANVLVRGFLLKGKDALKVFKEWNQESAKPPWGVGELLHKMADAEKSHTFQWGYLLLGDRDKYAPLTEEEQEETSDAEPEAPESEEDETDEATDTTPQPKKRKRDERLVFVVAQNKFYVFPEGVNATPEPRDQGLAGIEFAAAVGALQKMGVGFRSATQICKEKRCVIVDDLRRWPTNERILEHGNKTFLNPFWTIIPEAESGKCPNLDALVRAIGGDEKSAEWLWNWAAYIVQNPNALPGVCVVARGYPGVGKSKLGEVFGLCRGVYATVTNSAFHSEFNSRWADARFINAAEVMLADSRKEDNQRFLSLITDPQIEFHRKNQSAYEIENRIAWWLTSNLDNPVLVPYKDRRFTILDAQAPPDENMAALKQAWKKYDRRYHEWPELRAFKYKLLHYKVNEALARKPFINEAHIEVQEASRSSIEAFCDELSRNGWWPLADRYPILQGVTTTDDCYKPGHLWIDPAYIHRVYSAWCKDVGMGVTGYPRFVTSGAIRRFTKSPQRTVKGIQYRFRLVPAGTKTE